jgi:hypothetical protein
MKMEMYFLLILNLLITSNLEYTISDYLAKERPIHYEGYEYKLRIKQINDTLTLADNFTTNISYDKLYDNYVFTPWCSFGIIHAESFLETIKVFLITAGHCVNHAYQYNELIRPKHLELFNNCEVLLKDTELNLAVLMCNSYKDNTEIYKPMKPALEDSDPDSVNPERSITYVFKFTPSLEKKKYIWPTNIDCLGKDKTTCEKTIINFFRVKGWVIGQVNGSILTLGDNFLYSDIGCMIKASGALASFDDSDFFDAILLGGIAGATEMRTQFVSTRSKEFRLFYNEAFKRIQNLKTIGK